ncbi:MAG: hypothetical protein HFG41_13895 [Coprococcus sp.]|nr:hypothetical protein [Coprococcus sp.]
MEEVGKNKKKGWLFLILYTVFLVVISVIYVCILEFVPKGLELRTWYTKDAATVLLLVWMYTAVKWAVSIRRRLISRLSKRGGRAFLSAAVWLVCIVVIGFCGILILAANARMDSEMDNGDGTITVKWDIWLDSPEYSVYEKEGILYRRHLRSLNNRRRINLPSESQTGETGSQTDETGYEQNTGDFSRTEHPEEGYRAVYDAFLSQENDLYQMDYDAKGYSRVILYEDERVVRYLVYDRDSQNGKCALYVYYECEKGENGLWSSVDAIILDMYAYKYEDGTVIDSIKTSWEELGTEEYREATGE